MKIGKKIKKIRKSKEITQEELANLVGVSQAFISSVENNKKNISLDTLKDVCKKGLKISLSEFFSISNDQKELINIIDNLRKNIKLLIMKKDEIDKKEVINKSKSLDKALSKFQNQKNNQS